MLDLKPGQTLYDLGCGDGRMLKAAAKLGLKAVGYEMSPILVLIARLVNFRYRKQVKVIMGNYWTADISAADGIFIFLLDKYMPKLDRKIKDLHKPIKVASYTFQIPGKKPVKKANAVFLYSYK
jgi:SAM-dependent methyltransferase